MNLLRTILAWLLRCAALIAAAVMGAIRGRWAVMMAAPVTYGRDSGWPPCRREWLLEHPTCAACGTTLDLNVHHKEPVHKNPKRELDRTNLVTLCERPQINCHLNVGHLGSFRSWNDNVEADAAWWLWKRSRRP